MRPLFITIYAVLLALPALSAKFPITQSRRNSVLNRRSGSSDVASTHSFHNYAVVSENNTQGLTTRHDIIYMTDISIGRNLYHLQLDTGSSDLWIKGPSNPLPNSDITELNWNLTYGIGWAFGHVAYAHVEFAGITIDRQAFLDVSDAKNPALGYGAQGIVGLGFTSLSTVDALVNRTGSSDGRSLLFNLFEDHPSEPNYIAISLHRSAQPDDEVEGTFSIGEVDDKYTSVLDRKKIPTWPEQHPKRWNVIIESIIVGDKHIPITTTVPNVPRNRAVALLDSGTSFTYAPPEVVDAIYKDVPGASFNDEIGQWIVPCNAEIDMALQINGEIYPLHPLDALPKGLFTRDGCVGSWVPEPAAIGAGEFDWLLGDNVLRAMYIVYDFGDFDDKGNMGDPYVKILPLVEPNEGSGDFVKLRGGVARNDIKYSVNNNSAGDPVSTSANLSADTTKQLVNLAKYFPLILAVLGLNVLLIILAFIFGIVYFCRRRKAKSKRSPRVPIARMSSMPVSTRNSYVAGSGSSVKDEHIYEPVSLAMTEDTTAGPTSPGFRKFDAQERPHSLVASLPSQSKLYQNGGAEDVLFSPPSAGFSGRRPTSVASLPPTGIYSPPPRPIDQPFTPPAIVANDTDDRASTHSRRSKNASQGEVPPTPTRATPPSPSPSQQSGNAPMAITTPTSVEDGRPQSILVNAPRMSHIVDDVDTPSTAFYSPAAVSPDHQFSAAQSQVPNYSSPMSPPSASRPARSHLRPSAVGLNSNGDRPMSVGILPSQRIEPPSPTQPRMGSSLRPGVRQGSMNDRPMSLAGLPSQHHGSHHVVAEEDITTFSPPAPAFRRG